MNDTPANDGARRTAAHAHARAAVEHSGWPGWIWSIPIAVLLIVGWLGIRYLLNGNEDITIQFEDVHGLKDKSSTVVYRGMTIGRVIGLKLAKDGHAVTVTASIDGDATKYLREGTRFWLRGAVPSMSNLSSLEAMLSGPKVVMEPGPGKKSKHFVGLVREPLGPPGAHPVLYEVSLGGNVGSLKSGARVKLNGFTIGEVLDVGFAYDAPTGALSMPATIAIYPALFPMEATPRPEGGQALRAAIAGLIDQGLRARLEQDPPLLGSYSVALELLPGAPPVKQVNVAGLPQIPAAAGGGLASILSRVNKVPIEQIAKNVLDATRHIDALVSSPKLEDSIVQLDAALRQIKRTTAKAGPQITSLTTVLRKTAGELDDTARSADRMISGTATQDGLNATVQEITEAARAVRSLANYLDRHPEALIKGR